MNGSDVKLPCGLLHTGGAAETAHEAGTTVGWLPQGAYDERLPSLLHQN